MKAAYLISAVLIFLATWVKSPAKQPAQDFIFPKYPINAIPEWDANNGYCGEVGSIQAGMSHGQWMSPYNARSICGTGLSQSGPDGFCEANHGNADYNAQFLLENLTSGNQTFASAGLCLKNAHLNYELYDYSKELPGMEGFKQYLSWIKAQVIRGNHVTVAVLAPGGTDPQYDHEISVSKIGTYHGITDPSYYDDDVLYFEGPDTQGHPFQSLAKSRADANIPGIQGFSILIPGAFPTFSQTGGDGIHVAPAPIIAKNYAFSVSGVADPESVTLPVTLALVGSSGLGGVHTVDWSENVCTNLPPINWMKISLLAQVSELVPGAEYNLYEYDFDGISGVGEAAALAVPESKFNQHANQATKVTHFVATDRTFSTLVQTTFDKIVVLRCVSKSAA